MRKTINDNGTISLDHARTLQVLNELAKGKRLPLSNGYIIAMGEDMTVGYVVTDIDGKEKISGWAEFSLSALNSILTKEGINTII